MGELNVLIDVNIFNFEKLVETDRDYWEGLDYDAKLSLWREFTRSGMSRWIRDIKALNEALKECMEMGAEKRCYVDCKKERADGKMERLKERSRRFAGINAEQLAYDYMKRCEKDGLFAVIFKDGDFVTRPKTLDIRSKADKICKKTCRVSYEIDDYKLLGNVLSSAAYEIWLELTDEQKSKAFEKVVGKFLLQVADAKDVCDYITDEYS